MSRYEAVTDSVLRAEIRKVEKNALKVFQEWESDREKKRKRDTENKKGSERGRETFLFGALIPFDSQRFT